MLRESFILKRLGCAIQFAPEYERTEDEFLESFSGKNKEINIKLSIQQIQMVTFSCMMYVLKNDNVARESIES